MTATRRSRALALPLAMAVMMFSLLGRGDGTAIEEATPGQLRAAQKAFEAADELYDGQRFEAAIAAFRMSFDIVASPNSRLMIARSMRKLGNLTGAYTELEDAVSLAEKAAAKDRKYGATLKAVREELAALRAQVAILRVEVDGPQSLTSLTVEGRAVDVAELSRPLITTPGTISLVARADGYEALQQTLDVGAGETAD